MGRADTRPVSKWETGVILLIDCDCCPQESRNGQSSFPEWA